MITLAAALTAQTWFARWWPVILPILAILLSASAAGIWAMINRRGEEKNKATIPLPPTWPEMWARIDKLEKANEALENRVASLEREKHEILEHVVVLESMIPEPPPRPTWMQSMKRVEIPPL